MSNIASWYFGYFGDLMKLTSIVLTILLVLGTALPTTAEDKPVPAKAVPNADHRREGDQLLRAARDVSRVQYSKTGTAPDKVTDAGVEIDDFTGKHFSVTDKVYVVGDKGKKAALTAEPVEASDGFAILIFEWASGNSDIKWYDTFDALKEAHDDVEFDDDEAEDPDGDEADADAFSLYKKKGTTWTTKHVTKIAGMDDMVSYAKNEVTEVTKKSAKMKMWMLDKDKKPMAGMEAGTEYEVKFAVADVEPDPDAPKIEVTEETIKVEAGEFECFVTDANGTKVWSSKKHPGLLVKLTHASGSAELVEFKEG
jgi:hypothetical protein